MPVDGGRGENSTRATCSCGVTDVCNCMYGGNTLPTERTVREKLERTGPLFASDEVRVLTLEIDRPRRQVENYREHNRQLVEKYVGTGRA